jgi:alpha-beta hydrolase superfamily lysophospholipase
MKKSRILAGLGGAALGAAAAKGYLDYYRPGPPPGAAELEAYFDSLFDTMGLPGLAREIEEDWTECGGERIHLDVFESEGGGPAMVFVPGTSVYARFYAEYMHKMRLLGFNVVGFDPRGHGQSGGSRGSYTVATLLQDAAAVVTYAIDRFGGGVAISGSSQGGIVSFYAAASDERLKAAVCHNIAVLGEPEALRISRWPALSGLASKLMPLAGLTPELRLPVSIYLDLAAEPTRFGPNALQFCKADPLVVLAVAVKALASLSSTAPPRPVEQIRVPLCSRRRTRAASTTGSPAIRSFSRSAGRRTSC